MYTWSMSIISTLTRTTVRSNLAPSLFVLLLCSAACGDKAPPLVNNVALTVTDTGFEPQNLRVHEGKPVNLTITRKSDTTCATEIVIDEYAVNVKLPLNEPVLVAFTPKKTGELKYGCAMQKMVGGVISVE